LVPATFDQSGPAGAGIEGVRHVQHAVWKEVRERASDEPREVIIYAVQVLTHDADAGGVASGV
jgi:hypothetical protein